MERILIFAAYIGVMYVIYRLIAYGVDSIGWWISVPLTAAILLLAWVIDRSRAG